MVLLQGNHCSLSVIVIVEVVTVLITILLSLNSSTTTITTITSPVVDGKPLDAMYSYLFDND